MKYIGLDQYGNYHRLTSNHPRKELLQKLGFSKADKMWIDTKEGAKHIGYVIGGLWISLYKVEAI